MKLFSLQRVARTLEKRDSGGRGRPPSSMMRAIVTFLIFSAFVLCAQAGEDEPTAPPAGVPSVESFQVLPILFNGRVMPMDSYARNLLLQFSGRRTADGDPAAAWLAQLLLAPETTHDRKVFLINHPEVAQALGIETEKHRRYSYHQLQPGLPKMQDLARKAARLEQEDRSEVENELVRVFGNAAQYAALANAFNFAAASRDFTVTNSVLKRKMGLPEGRDIFRFMDVVRGAPALQDTVSELADTGVSTWTDEEQEAFRLSSALFTWSRRYGDISFPLVPTHRRDEDVWLSPWEALSSGVQDEEMMDAMEALAELPVAYHEDAQLEFDLAARRFGAFVHAQAHDPGALRHLDLEVLFNRFGLFGWAAAAYAFAFILALVYFIVERRLVFRLGMAMLLLALVPHTAGMIARVVIMGRPPVTNLYATFLFVGWICAILGLLMERAQRNGVGLLASSFAGLAMIFVANKFFSDGDTMGKVVAVLDSNFWLSTHVIAITVGYAGCIFAGLIGHVYLLHAVFAPKRKERLDTIYEALFGLLAFGLLFSFLGTMLGGVWADQSWGRFWGWDPKENGALLIVLWTALLFHARLGKMIGRRGMAGGAVLGVIVVMAAWLGVNLLSVGLHSYGFTSGLAAAFFGLIAFECLFVAVVVPLAGNRA